MQAINNIEQIIESKSNLTFEFTKKSNCIHCSHRYGPAKKYCIDAWYPCEPDTLKNNQLNKIIKDLKARIKEEKPLITPMHGGTHHIGNINNNY